MIPLLAHTILSGDENAFVIMYLHTKTSMSALEAERHLFLDWDEHSFNCIGPVVCSLQQPGVGGRVFTSSKPIIVSSSYSI